MSSAVLSYGLTDDEHYAARVLSRADYYSFVKYMFLMRRGYKWRHAPHHKLICDKLTDVYEGRCRRLIINMPPRYSKSDLAVVNFIPWCLGKMPDCEFITASYTALVANTNSFNARSIVENEHYRAIFPETVIRWDTNARDNWKTTVGGVVLARGSEGSITGFGAGKARDEFGGCGLIDDPNKPDDKSDEMLRKVQSWYVDVFERRLNDPKRTPIILIQQRTGEDDLTGFLLGGGSGEEWAHLCIPALAEENDPLGRAPGEPLWEEMHSRDMLKVMERSQPMMFAGQYQQRPSPAQGLIFKPDELVIVDAAPRVKRRVRAWDLAATENDGDWTVGALLAEMEDGRLVIEDIRALQGGPDEVETAIIAQAGFDGPLVWVDLPQDPGQAGKAQAARFGRMLKGYVVNISLEMGDKAARAGPIAAQVNLGNVLMVRGEWNAALVHEMRMFPNGKHDDRIDALARAAARLLIDNSGDSIFQVSSLLVENSPAYDPQGVDFIFATIATGIKTGQPDDALGVVYWALSRQGIYPLHALDWEIAQIGPDWSEAGLLGIFKRMAELATKHIAHHGVAGLWVENRGAGIVVLEQAKRRQLRAWPIDTALTKMGVQEKAASVSGYIHAGKLKLIAHAYEKAVMYRGVDRNQLLGQILACRIGAKNPAQEEELLTAFLDGAMIALGNSKGW